MDKETFSKMEGRINKYKKLKETSTYLDTITSVIADGRVSRIIAYDLVKGERNFNIPMEYQLEISQLIINKLAEIKEKIEKKMEEV